MSFNNEKVHAKAWVELYPSNGTVTDWYIRSIGYALSNLGFDVGYVDDCVHIGNRKQDLYVVSVAKSAALLSLKGCKHLIYWAQGIAPEEDYLRFHSTPRKIAFDLCEKIALKRASHIFMVSSAMLRHFEGKYHLHLKDKAFIAPCSNETMHSDSFFVSGKYKHPIFTYAGGLSRYQCIDRMLDLFGRIQLVVPDAELLFYTWDLDKAKKLVSERALSNVKVENKAQEELFDALSGVKYGFVIRDDILINRVATPTKLSTYMANGVLPIVSDCLEDFAKASESLEYVICCPEANMVEAIQFMEQRNIDPRAVQNEYEIFFDRYFNLEKKQGAMMKFLLPLMEDMGR